jgi:hypothetical protein
VDSLGIGFHDAKAALMVAATLEETSHQKSLTLSRALAEITQRLTTKHVLECIHSHTMTVSPQEADELSRGNTDEGASSSILASAMSSSVPASSETHDDDTTTIMPQQTPLSQVKKGKQSSFTLKTATAKKARSRLAEISEKTANTTGKNHQPPAATNTTTRSRSDSVDTQVHDKLETATTSAGNVTSVALSTRAKRKRSDDATVTTTTTTTTTTASAGTTLATAANSATPGASRKRLRPARA